MNQIDNAPLSTPIQINNEQLWFGRAPGWSKWFSQLVTALFRPTVTNTPLTFAATGAQNSRDVVVVFPAGTVALNDVPVLSAPAPPANTSFTCHIAAVDQVTVRFNNYSSGSVAFGPANFSLTILKQ